MAAAIAVCGWFSVAQAAQRTWTGTGDMQWSQPDSTSWDAPYAAGDDVLFTDTGLGTIQIVGTVTPSNLVFIHTSGTNTFIDNSAFLHAGGSFSNIGGGVVQFGNMASAPLGGLTWTGATYIGNGSELRLTRATHVGLPGTPINLNGGTVSFGADNSAVYVVSNPVVVAAGGGTIRAEFSGNLTRFQLRDSITGSGPLRLQSVGSSPVYSGLGLWADNSGFNGPVLIDSRAMDLPKPPTVRPAAVWFTNTASMFPNASQIAVRDGGVLGVEFALSDADLAKVQLGPRGGLAARFEGTFGGVSAPMARIPAGGILLLDNYTAVNNNRYPDAQPLALTNNQLVIWGRNAASAPVNEAVGDMTVGGGAHLFLRRQNSTGSGVVLSPASLATPGTGSSLLIETEGSSLGETLNDNSVAIATDGARPAVTNGMLPPSLQYYTGGNNLGHFLNYGTTDTNRIVGATYTSTDINAAGPSDLVNIGASAQTLTSSKTVHALRLGQNLTLNSGVTLTLGSGGLIMSSVAIDGSGTLDFGSMPAYIGVYNAAAQANVRVPITGSGGMVILGTSQTLNITNIYNTFTGGIWINGGAVRFYFTAANGNDVTVNPYGRLVAGGTSGLAIDRIGGLQGVGLVSAWSATAGTSTGMLEIAAPNGTYLFDGAMTNGNAGRTFVLIKSGGATQILGSNFVGHFTGFTIVSGGVLQVDGNLARSPVVSVVNGGRLQGTGLIGGEIVVSGANSTLAPGASPGTLTVSGNVTMASGTIFEAEILGSLSGEYDVLAMMPAATLTLGGATLSVIAPSALPYLSVYPVITGWGSIASSTFDGLPDGATFTAGANQFLINYGTKAGYADSVTLTVVPEPGSLAIPSLIGLMLFLRRHRR